MALFCLSGTVIPETKTNALKRNTEPKTDYLFRYAKNTPTKQPRATPENDNQRLFDLPPAQPRYSDNNHRLQLWRLSSLVRLWLW